MRKYDRLNKILQGFHWYSLGYIDGDSSYTWVKDFRAGKRRRQGSLKAAEKNGRITFSVAYKKHFTADDVTEIFDMQQEFLDVWKEYHD